MKLSCRKGGAAMYVTEELKHRTTLEEYAEDYREGKSFSDYYEKNMENGSLWCCPLYDFNPEGYEKKYKYLYLLGKRLTFTYSDKGGERAKKRIKKRIRLMCVKEKEGLLEKIQLLEAQYPGSAGLAAGRCLECSRWTRVLDEGCRYSDEARYFMKSLGNRVGEVPGELLGIELQWLKGKLPEQYDVIVGFLTDCPDLETNFNVDTGR